MRDKTGQSRRLPGRFRELKVLPESIIRIFDDLGAIEDSTKRVNVYNHLNAKATMLKGTS